MTPDELKTKVEELEALIKTGNDYALAETQARELLVDDTIANESELHCRILLALSISLWERGMAQDSLPYSEEILVLVEKVQNIRYKAKALSNIGVVHYYLSDYAKALEYYTNALALYEELGSKTDAARVTSNIANVYSDMSEYLRALEYYNRALVAHEELSEKNEVAKVIEGIGIVYGRLSDYPRALEYFGRALASYNELEDKSKIASGVGNIGSVYANLSDYPRALEYFGRALAEYEKLGSKSGIALFTENIGRVHADLSDYPHALEYFGKALAKYEELGDKSAVAHVVGNIGRVYAKPSFDGYDPEKAEEFLLKANALNEELGTKGYSIEVFESLADLYEHQKRWKEANEFNKKYYELEKEVQSEDAKKQAERLDFERKNAEREKQLAAERARFQERENILNNILPEEITTRLIAGESPIADTFDCVSILFVDIVDFTALSTKVSARQLVHLLNAIFTATDGVMREFGLEKIKTIGDAYMAVAGAPIVQEDHAQRAANAALKLLEVMENLEVSFPPEYGDRSWIENVPEIEVRIGLHCGQAAAGVVGENKFLYDLWGDAVNTAARMESHGEAGKIHVSEEFVRELGMRNEELRMKDKELTGDNSQFVICNSQFIFVPRGEMEIKGKGMMRTYFLERVSAP